MIQNTAEKFLLLIQHPTKSKFLVAEHIKNAGLIGSILLDLANEKRIEIESGKLMLKSTNTKLSPAHAIVLRQIESAQKSRKVKTWIMRFSRKIKKYQIELLLELEREKVVKIEYEKFLFFKYYRTRLVNCKIREQLIDEIRERLLNFKQFSSEDALILGLIKACNMYKIVCKNKQEIKICKNRINEIIKSNSIALGVDEVIKEMQAAIFGAVVTSSLAATMSAH